jgi:hypothetical protein
VRSAQRELPLVAWTLPSCIITVSSSVLAAIAEVVVGTHWKSNAAKYVVNAFPVGAIPSKE